MADSKNGNPNFGEGSYFFMRGPLHLTTLSLVQISTFIRDDLSVLKYLCVVLKNAKQSVKVESHISL